MYRMRYSYDYMSKLSVNQAGFIPMLLSILAVVVAVIFFVYFRVMHAHR